MKSRLQEDMKTAMKSGNKNTLDVVRMIISEIKKEEIDAKKELPNDDIIRIIKKGIKTREESLKMYTEGNRPDLVQKEKEEIEFLKGYLPKQLTEPETEKIITSLISELGVSSKKDMGRLMKEVMGRYGSQVEGKIAQGIVQKKLQ